MSLKNKQAIQDCIDVLQSDYDQYKKIAENIDVGTSELRSIAGLILGSELRQLNRDITILKIIKTII